MNICLSSKDGELHKLDIKRLTIIFSIASISAVTSFEFIILKNFSYDSFFEGSRKTKTCFTLVANLACLISNSSFGNCNKGL